MVGHEDWGEVQFLLPVDLRGLNLDSVVAMAKGRIQVLLPAAFTARIHCQAFCGNPAMRCCQQ